MADGNAKVIGQVEGAYKAQPRPLDLVHPERSFNTSGLEEMLGSILRFAQQATSPERREFVQPDRVKLTTFPSGKAQAATTWLGPVHLVGLNRGLILFVYRVARVLAAYFIDPRPGDAPLPPIELSGRRIAALMSWMASPLAAPWVFDTDDFRVSERIASTAGNIAECCEHFVLAHEVAHIQMGHRIPDAPRSGTFAAANAEGLDAGHFRQEVEADTCGMVVHLESMAVEGLEPRAAVVGIFFFLECLMLAESVGAIRQDVSHQPAHDRAHLLRRLLHDRYGAGASYLLTWADDILAKSEPSIRSAIEQHAKYAAAVDHLLEAELRARPAPGRHHASDQEFVDRVASMLARAPDVVLRKLAANVLSREEYLACCAAQRSLEERAQHDPYRRHSLAVFFSQALPPEVAAAAGIEPASQNEEAP